jgi:hypothetical protein
MNTSKLIAALLGPTLVATALMVLINLGAMPGVIEELSKSPMLIVLAGYAAFVPGLAIVYFHNRWTASWPTLITLFGWLSVVVGFIRMVFPVQLAGVMSRAAFAPPMHIVLPAIGVVFLLIGAVLSYKAYVRE